MDDCNKISCPVILFDGVCNLCVSSVQFIIKHDQKKYFRFASLQSDFGKSILQQFNLNENNFSTFILWEDGKIFTRSTAALKVAKQLSGGYIFLYYLIVIPAFIRDNIYNIIANHRYKWFGKKEECWLPKDEWNDLFLF